jgi:hypothetical protein
MSLMSRLTSTVRSLARSPAVRRGARDLGRAAVRAVQEQRGGDGARGSGSHGADGGGGRGAGARAGGASGTATLPSSEGGALADRRGPLPALAYAPHDDDRPDPGEVVWAWVPYEEDLSRGKDRPVLVIAEEDASAGGADGSGPVLVALMLTSRDRTESGATRTDEHGATWVDIGAGDWDRKGRPSEVRADRLLRLAPDAVRREGARLDRERFDRVAEAVRAAAA